MQLVNLKDNAERVTFAQAVKQGIGAHQGLFFMDKASSLWTRLSRFHLKRSTLS